VLGGQSLLRLLAGADVEQIPLREELSALGVLHHEALVLHPHRPAVARDQPVLGLEQLARAVAVLNEGEDALAVVRVEQLGEELRIGEPFVDGVAEQRLHLRAGVERRGAGGERIDVRHERQLLHERPVLRLRGTQPRGRIRPAANPGDQPPAPPLNRH
jgi:hypothetical protein